MQEGTGRIGVDIGSLYLKVVFLGVDGGMRKIVIPHSKDIVSRIKEFLFGVDGAFVGFTGSLRVGSNGFPVFDEVKCLIEGVKSSGNRPKYILNVGAYSSKLVEVDENFNLKNVYTNSVCAAGTGSFFDQQRDRLSLTYEEIGKWEVPKSEPPSIASRCTVFAKTDLVNRQQEGYSKLEMWAGLSKSMVKTILNTLFRGKRIDGKIILTGGVSNNKFFVHYLKEYLGENLLIDENSNFFQALGAALLSSERLSPGILENLDLHVKDDGGRFERNPPIVIEKSVLPSSVETEDEVIDGVEVSVYNWEYGKSVRVYLGIDVGSTSTKCVLVDEGLDVIAGFYTRTEGDPIRAVKRLFEVIERVKVSRGGEINVVGVGTTGSGRKLVGEFVGADVIENEIIAHARGALHFFPDAEVIFEIGGQDSKYIRLKNGKVFECSMNYVCSAGTGSFLEEQAKKLGFEIKKVSDEIIGISPPYSQERCTVFMEQDVEELLRMGFSRHEVLASCTYSVVHNYLNKVVGKRYIPKTKIIFQGATARNKSLVGAFEKVLGREVVVSRFCHLMGALGIAIIAKERMEKDKALTRFFGFGVRNQNVNIQFGSCSYCENNCKISYLKVGDRVASFGYQCGRDSKDRFKRSLKELEVYEKYEKLLFSAAFGNFESRGIPRRGTAYVPRILSTYYLFPFYRTFLEELGFKVLLSENPDKKTLEKGCELSSADFCLPVKLVYGVLSELSEKGDGYLFVPFTVNYPSDEKDRYTYFCPYVQSYSSFVTLFLASRNVSPERVISPVFDFSLSISDLVKQLGKAFERFEIKREEIKTALLRALEAQRSFEREVSAVGEEFVSSLTDPEEKVVVLFGRPYILFSNVLNMRVPMKIGNFSLRVVPWVFLSSFGKSSQFNVNMYWDMGKKMLEVAEFVKGKDNLYPVFVSTFSCGPDSFLLSYLEEIFDRKPFLAVEVDEHGGDAVLQTRLEVFYNLLKEQESKVSSEDRPFGNICIFGNTVGKDELRSWKIWIPSLNPDGARLFAASFRRFGFNAEALPLTLEKNYRTGKRLTRGSECLPCITTIGTFVDTIKNDGSKKHVFFMPTSSGPCRFGQYFVLHNVILKREGIDVVMLSPTCYNGYAGLPYHLRKFLFKAIAVYDVLFKCRNRIAPYERNRGETERVYADAISYIEKSIESGEDIYCALEESVKMFKKVEVTGVLKPLVGIVGEIYVRFDPFSNDNLISVIEECGGEAWLSPFLEWVWYVSWFTRRKSRLSGDILNFLIEEVKSRYYRRVEEEVYEIAGDILHDRKEPSIEEILKEAWRYFPENFGTESPLTIGRAVIFKNQGARVVVNVAPFTCMPGNITTAIFNALSDKLNIPVVNMFYDGTKGANEKLRTFLRNYISA